MSFTLKTVIAEGALKRAKPGWMLFSTNSSRGNASCNARASRALGLHSCRALSSRLQSQLNKRPRNNLAQFPLTNHIPAAWRLCVINVGFSALTGASPTKSKQLLVFPRMPGARREPPPGPGAMRDRRGFRVIDICGQGCRAATSASPSAASGDAIPSFPVCHRPSSKPAR